MDSSWNNEAKQINKYNGQSVMATLSLLGSKATKSDLVKRFVSMTSQPHKAVDQELSRILNNGVKCGFIRKIDNEYLLPTYRGAFETDSGAASCESEAEPEPEIDHEAEFLNELKEIIELRCRTFRTKLFEIMIDVVMAQCKEVNLDQLKQDFKDQTLHLSTIPEDHVDECTKSKLTEFFGAAFELIHLHGAPEKQLRYTVVSVDKHILAINMCTFGPEKQESIKRFIEGIEQLEKNDCEKFRTIYIHHILNKVTEALREGAQHASEVFMRLNLEDNCEENFSCTVKNLIQKAFLNEQSKNCSIGAYFNFLAEQKAKECKGMAARKRKKAKKF